jgi:NADPH-dependent F420 reductase
MVDSAPNGASQQPDVHALTVGVLGGTGAQGRGLAYRFAAAGLRVLVGSRDAAKGKAAAETVNEMLAGAGLPVTGEGNQTVAADADIVVIAVPWEGHSATVAALRSQLAGKLVVDCVIPLGFDKKGAYALAVDEGSATEQAAALLPDSRVTGAFHHISAVLLADPSVQSIDTDVMVVGEDRDSTDLVQALADVIPGMRGVYAGRLRNARQVEALTANLISINRRYKAHAGIRITDV